MRVKDIEAEDLWFVVSLFSVSLGLGLGIPRHLPFSKKGRRSKKFRPRMSVTIPPAALDSSHSFQGLLIKNLNDFFCQVQGVGTVSDRWVIFFPDKREFPFLRYPSNNWLYTP